MRLKIARILTVALVALLSLALSDSAVANTEYTHTLQPGQRLYPGDILYSPSHAYRLVMQGDGNLVLYTGGTALWSSKTNGQDGANAVMQGDGNFVVYQSGKAIWNSGTNRHDGAILDMQDDGNLVIYWENTAIWSTGTNQPAAPQPPSPSPAAPAPTEYTHTLQPGQRLYPGDILYSPSHAYRLVMQGDGNLVLYRGGKALWSSKTNGHNGANAVMQGDGNFVVYLSGKAIWNSGTDHHSGAILDMQDDGNLIVYQSGKAIWSTGTGNSPSHSSGHSVGSGYWLRPGTIIYSSNHRYRLVMQGDGNLVVYQGGKALWSTSTQGHQGAQAVMQGDGNLVVYWNGKAIWNSGTDHHDGAILDMQDDGNLVIYWQGRAVWASKNASASSQGMAIVRAAASQARIPYCLGGGNQFGPTPCGGMPATFDCTGLTMYAVYKATGKVLTHDGRQGTEGGRAIRNKSELRPGDLVFFGRSFSNFLHAGVYAGNGEFWDANNWGVPVQKHSMAWEEHGLAFVGGARYWH